ncbi:hypothetical protein BC833DRAFT_591862 [Globomyces pollinis-pini]|nr:hypothetical protein BC833DRAFT_591862 [Globomyces pollinis-pini]KAJ2997352.1 hypothetical protein HDV02_005624 [Globomyces sp. JEL0801]
MRPPTGHPESKKPGPKPGRSKALEERLKKLEAIVDALNLDEHSVSDSQDEGHKPTGSPNSHMSRLTLQSVIPASPAPSAASQFPPYVDYKRPDLEELFFAGAGAGYCFLSEDQARKAMNESTFLRFVFYALAASVAPPSMVNAEFGSRQEMADIYFRKSETFLRRIFRKPSFHGVLGLLGLVIYCTRTNRGPETYYYYTVGIRIAISIGLNSEEAYTRQGMSEENKEMMRRTWWSIYFGDRLLSALRYENPIITDAQCLIRLPSHPTNQFPQAHPQDYKELLEVGIMSSDELYVLTLRNLSVNAYTVILVKIHSRIAHITTNLKGHSKKKSQALFLLREMTIRSALNDWHNALPDSIRNVLQEINSDIPPADPKTTWNNAFLMFLYHAIKCDLPKLSLFRNIETDANLAASCTAAREVFLSACDCAAILQGFLKHNPSFSYVPPFLAYCIFGVGIMILVVSRMNLNPNDISMADLSYQTIKASLAQQSALYNIGTQQKILLERFETCRDPVLLVLAIKSLGNLRGDSLVDSKVDMLVPSPEEELDEHPLFNQPTSQPMQMEAFGNSELLESVAEMSNPYADLMMGVGLNNDVKFDAMFDFSHHQ